MGAVRKRVAREVLLAKQADDPEISVMKNWGSLMEEDKARLQAQAPRVIPGADG